MNPAGTAAPVPPPGNPPPTSRELLLFFLPLAMAHVMMSGGTPVVNAGIARCADPVAGLAAFAVAFSVSLFLDSPCFGLEPAAVALIHGPRSFAKMAAFSGVIGGVLTGATLLLALTPAAAWLFEGLFGLNPRTAEMSAASLAVLSPMPLLISFRSAARGALISLSNTGAVGWGTALRFVAMTVVTVLGIYLPFSGPVIGALAFLAGILGETVYVLLVLRRRIDRLPGDHAGDTGTAYRSILRFSLPIVLSGLFAVTINMTINAVLTRTRDAEAAVSAFSVLRSVAWFIASMLVALQQVMIAKGIGPEAEAAVGRFSLRMTLAVAAVLALISYTPLGVILMRDVIGVQGAPLEAASMAMLWIPLLPFALGWRSFLRGRAIALGRTFVVLPSAAISLFVAWGLGWAVKDLFPLGAYVAVFMWIVVNGVEAAILWPVRRRSDSPAGPLFSDPS